MSIINELITDRTQQDVNYIKSLNKKGWAKMTVEERLYYLKGIVTKFVCEDGELYAQDGMLFVYDGSSPKGAYNESDLNRVEAALKHLESRLKNSGYVVNISSDSWKLGEISFLRRGEQYLERVKSIKNAIPCFATTPNVPLALQGLTFVEANAIEQILFDIDKAITLSELSHCYSGEIYTGEVGI